MLRVDIFCTVVDNFGDAGVCWRLARQLAGEYGQSVRLFIDDVGALAQIWPEVNADLCVQQIAGVLIIRWDAVSDWHTDVDVVIEAFACRLPAAYEHNMRPKFWFNLEYLTAETWADEYHNLNSPQTGGLNKIFFFPGFSDKTGGLLREHHLNVRRDAWADVTGFVADKNAFKISLFAYAHAPIKQWLPCLMASTQPVQLAVTHGQAADAVRRAGYEAGQYGALEVRFLPMLAQNVYDELLWSSDLNDVRGEDSLVRALWAGVPFVWHIYAQDDGVHWHKLDAFVQRYDGGDAWRDWQQFWNGDAHIQAAPAWQNLMHDWSKIQQHARLKSEYWAQFDDLAQQLMRRCGVLARKRL